MEGDGIGPEITAATLGVLGAAARAFALDLSFSPVAVGFAALRAHGSTLPDAAAEAAQRRRRRDPRAGLAQRLSAGGARRSQSVGRIAKAPRPVRQYPPGAQPRRLSAPLRRARRPRDRAREHRGLLRRPLDVSRLRRVHAHARPRAVRAQDHARGLDPHRRGRLRAGARPPQQGDGGAQGQRACGSPTGCSSNACARWRRASRPSTTRSGSWTRWRRCWCATPARSTWS